MRTLKQLLKTIFKYRLSSGLTILSLVVAFLGIIVLSLYVSYERSFDKFHKNGDDIYMLSFNLDMGGGLPVPMGELIKEKVPEIEKSAEYSEWYFSKVLYQPKQTRKDAVNANMYVASKDFFNMFDFPLLSGDQEKALLQNVLR